VYWYNQQRQRFLTPEEDRKLAQQQAQQAQQEVQLLRERLRSLGIDPDSLT
jgi:hypothetical protein